jgi:succinate-semialdehyde dehydrogenase/glutarate-semialdehyde dehydrogenase
VTKQNEFLSINPTTEQVIGRYSAFTAEQRESVLREAVTAWKDWRGHAIDQRSRLIRTLGQKLRQSIDELAQLATLEMGKPIAQSRSEIEKCALLCDYYAEHAGEFLALQRVSGNGAAESFVRFDPLGIVLAIMPWNFPFWQVFRFAVPTLLAGNVGVLKHATNVLGCAHAIAEVFPAAGFPPGVMSNIDIGSESVADLIADRRVQAVTLTGSEAAGRSVGKASGKSLKKCVLELGGSDPFIVLADANLPKAIEQAVASRTLNNGQSCIAAKRFIVVREIYEDFTQGMCARMASLRMGDPLDENVELGPLARKDLRELLDQQVRASTEKGAMLAAGGKVPDRPGWFYEPTVLINVNPEMAAFNEETFGPVAAIIPAHDEREAVQLANSSRFGLGASLWTENLDRARELAGEIEAGGVFINALTRSDPSLPFGGIKDSGFGRELGEFGIREFVNIKTVWIGK